MVLIIPLFLVVIVKYHLSDVYYTDLFKNYVFLACLHFNLTFTIAG